MGWIWQGLRLPMLAAVRLWRCKRQGRMPVLDPRSLNAHWRRDLGFDT
jgi:hypothetical protein